MNSHHKSLVLLAVLIVTIFLGGCQATVVAPEEEAPATAVPAVEDATAVPEKTAPPAAATATETVAATPVPAPEEDTAAGMVEVTVAGVSLAYPAEIAEEISAATMPATELAADEWEMRYLAHPAMTHLEIAGFPVSREYQQAQINLLPVEAASSLQLRAEQRVERLQALMDTRPETPLADDELPFLPVYNAAQMMHAKEEYLSFANGSGLRYLTMFAQDYVPVTNQFLEYTFQGMTADGRFYVSASFPVRSDALPEDIAAAQAAGWDGSTYYVDEVAYDSYVAEERVFLEGLSPDDFEPSLDTLDALVRSLDLSAYAGPDVEAWVADVLPMPDQVVDDFIERYTAAGGFWGGSYAEDPALHPEYVAELRSISHWWEEQGADMSQYDPVLMSANLGAFDDYAAVQVAVGPAWIEAEQARVPVERRAHPGSVVLPLTYSLQWSEEAGTWQITGVTTILSHPQRSPTPAEELTEYVYGLGLAARPGFEGANVAKLAPPSDVGFDLCGQDCPWGFAVEGAVATGETDEAGNPVYDAVLYTSFRNDVHVVRAEPRGSAYVITEAIRASSPVERARAFYTWYLAEAANYMETRWAPRQPRIAGMNEFPIFVSEAFLHAAKQRMIEEDPYLPGGQVPAQFWVEAGPEDNTALVHLLYDDSETTVRLTFVEEMGRPLIDSIELDAS